MLLLEETGVFVVKSNRYAKENTSTTYKAPRTHARLPRSCFNEGGSRSH
jgi:hypothetical protein